MMKIRIVLPAYNEAKNLPAIFSGIRSLLVESPQLQIQTIVVNDGSSDDTAQISKREGAEVLENPKNLGLAATFMRGMRAAIERADDEDVIVCMDADNSHLPGQIPAMVRSIGEGRDVVIASRYRTGATILGVSFFRRMLSQGMSILFRLIYPIPGVRDYSCGFRAYRASTLKKAIRTQGDRLFAKEGFACMVGILLRLHKEGARCGEIPMTLRYDQKMGASKMKIGKTVFLTFRILFRERFCRD